VAAAHPLNPRTLAQPPDAALLVQETTRMNVRAAVSHLLRLPSRRRGGSLGRLMTAGLIAALLLLGSAAADQRLAPTASAQGPVVIRISFQPLPIDAPLLVAKDKGYFEKAGVNVEMVELWQASEILASYAAGGLDASAGGFGPAQMNAVDKGFNFTLVAPLHSERPPLTTPLVVRKELWDNGTIRSVADLKGHSVGLNSKGSATEYWLYAALATGGLTPNDIDEVAMPFPDAGVAMANGALDASLLGEPYATQFEQQGAIVRLAQDFVNDFQVTAIYFDTNFANSNRPAVEAFLAAYLQGARDLQGDGYHAPENLAILEKYTHVPAATIAVSALPYHDPDGNVHVDDFQKLNDFFVAQKVAPPVDMSKLIDPSYAEAARALLDSGLLKH
jgi:NitT/TauT family transport system substrate-binding protein